MNTDEKLERRLTDELRALLEAEPMRNPTWTESPAARRVTFEAAHRRRRPLRILAFAAILALGGASAAAGAWLFNREPSPAPAGSSNGWLAFTEFNGWTRDILFASPGVPLVRALGFEGDTTWETCPVFSPDGRTLAYIEARDGTSDTSDDTIAVVDLDDHGLPVGTPRRFPTLETAGCPDWSPDGKKIAYEASSGLHIVNLDDGTNGLLVGLGRSGNEVQPLDWWVAGLHWAADAQSLLYQKSFPTIDGDPTAELHSITLDGADTTLLSKVAFDLGDWSGDGRMAVGFNEPRVEPDGIFPGRYVIGQVDPTDGNWTLEELESWQASDYGFQQPPRWSPTGDRLAYIREGEVVVRGDNGTTTRVPLTGIESAKAAACLYGWSAQGDRILAVVANETFLDRGVDSALVELDPSGSVPPIVTIPMGAADPHCGGTWQVLGPDRAIRMVPPTPGANPPASLPPTLEPTQPPVPVAEEPSGG